MRKVAPVTPGEMLEEEFLKPLGMTALQKKSLSPRTVSVTSLLASAASPQTPTCACAVFSA